jgi:hypothetical protein
MWNCGEKRGLSWIHRYPLQAKIQSMPHNNVSILLWCAIGLTRVNITATSARSLCFVTYLALDRT